MQTIQIDRACRSAPPRATMSRSALGRLQLQRLREARADIFDDREATIAWLLAA